MATAVSLTAPPLPSPARTPAPYVLAETMEGEVKKLEELIHNHAIARVGTRKIATTIAGMAFFLSTVVLLGGFFSVLTTKDFWFVLALSLVLASRLLEFLDVKGGGIFMAEGKIISWSHGLDKLEEANAFQHWMNMITLYIVSVVKIIASFFLVWTFGLSWVLSIVLSLLRVVPHDFGNPGEDAASKIKMWATLFIFYGLVIAHALAVGYFGYLEGSEKWIWLCKQFFGFEVWGPKIVTRYRTETIAKCYKDGVLLKNWNLITFSVELLESACGDDHLWGARMLDTFIGKGISIRQEILASGQAVQSLIKMIICPIGTSADDRAEMRERAAGILAHIASELNITTQDLLGCIWCLLESSTQYSNPKVAMENQEDALNVVISPKRRSWIDSLVIRMGRAHEERETYFGNEYHYFYLSKGTKELVFLGLLILEKLTRDQDKCIEIIKHQRLILKITAPLSCEDLFSHEWDTYVMLSNSLTVVTRLVTAGPVDDTTKLHNDMSSNEVVVQNLFHILHADIDELKEQAIEILVALSTNMNQIFLEGLHERLHHIILKDKDIEAEQNEEKEKRVIRKAAEGLTRLFRVSSARGIDLLTKKAVTKLLERVVSQILSSEEEKTEENEEESKMLAAMLCLMVAICKKISGEDFSGAISDHVHAEVVKKLEKIVEMNKDATTQGWIILKLVVHVVISVVHLKPSCTTEFNRNNFHKVLSKALESMSGVDECMLMSGNHGEMPARSLASLVKEAQNELVAQV